MGAIYAAIFFLGATNSNTVQPVVAIERTVFYRERAAGMYSSLAYAIAQVSIETVYIAIQSIIYTLILFSMIDFGWRADKFFWFLFLTFMCFIYFTLYGMMVVGLTPSYQVAAIVATFFYSFWNLFCGFVIPRKLMPVWWRWMFWANPVAWTIYGLLVSQLGELDNMVEIPGEASLDVKTFLKQKLGYDHNFLGYVALAHLAFAFLFTFVFAYSIKFFNFQKR